MPAVAVGSQAWGNATQLALGLSLATFGPIAPAQAGPSLYATSFGFDRSQEACLKATRASLERAGMRAEDIEATTYKNDKGIDIQNGWRANHPSENISAIFECDARNGMGAMAVSGANNDATYDVYSRLWDLFLK